MSFVIVKVEKDGVPPGPVREVLTYYAGYECESFSKSGPIFNKTVTPRARLDERTADAVMKQLTELGCVVEKRTVADPKPRKGHGRAHVLR